jgi:putative drug exporter of the RND superfamily
VRSVSAPFPVEVTGLAARGVDTKEQMAERLPLALVVIVVTTFIALLALTGSVLAPIKALVVNTLSLGAVFGALVYVFQEGHLRWLVGDFTVTESINVLNPPLMFCIAFGLAMDYEVFLLSRIKEEHDRGQDNAGAIARGVQRTAPIITAAAGVMAIVFVAFSTSGVTNVKMIGVGLALAVALEATVVRAVLVPAVMRLAGSWNWWAPRPVRYLQDRLGWVQGEPVTLGTEAGR